MTPEERKLNEALNKAHGNGWDRLVQDLANVVAAKIMNDDRWTRVFAAQIAVEVVGMFEQNRRADISTYVLDSLRNSGLKFTTSLAGKLMVSPKDLVKPWQEAIISMYRDDIYQTVKRQEDKQIELSLDDEEQKKRQSTKGKEIA